MPLSSETLISSSAIVGTMPGGQHHPRERMDQTQPPGLKKRPDPSAYADGTDSLAAEIRLTFVNVRVESFFGILGHE